MSRVLVTGGSGYFGSFLCKILAGRGEDVHNFDLVGYDEPLRGVTVHLGDIRDPAAVDEATRGIDIVHHNVAQVPLAKNAGLFESVNRGGTRNLLEACLRNGVKKVISVSSSAVFGIPPKNPVDDSTAPRPMESYGKSKFEGELLCREYGEKGLDITIVRPRTILGHGRLGIFQILFDWIRDGANIPVLGNGGNLYQFVHAEDLADACIKASVRSGPSVYNIGAEKFCSMRDSLEGLIRTVGSASKVKNIPFAPAVFLMNLTSALRLSPLGPYHAMMYGRDMYFDISKAKKELNWRPRWDNVGMLVDSYLWYVDNPDKMYGSTERSHHRSPLKQGVLRLVKRVL